MIIKTTIVFLVVIANSLAQSYVAGNEIKNTKQGYKGFALTVAEEYNFVSYTDDEEPKNTIAALAWKIGARLDRGPGFTALEQISYKSDQEKGINVTTLRFALPIPSTKDEKKHVDFLYDFMFYVMESKNELDFKEKEIVGDNHVIKIGKVDGDILQCVYTVAIPPGTILAITGTCPKEKKNELRKDMDLTVRTLKIGGKN